MIFVNSFKNNLVGTIDIVDLATSENLCVCVCARVHAHSLACPLYYLSYCNIAFSLT